MKTLLERLHLRPGAGRTVEPPRLYDPVRFPYGPFKFKTRIPKDVSYEIEAGRNLTAWETIASATSTGDIDFIDSDASKFSYRFYRLHANGVFSTNIIGYVTVTLPPGFSMIGNPLRSDDSRISTLLKAMPDGMTVSRFDARLHELMENTLEHGKWSNESHTLGAGEGAIVFNPSTDYKSLSFVGDVLQGTHSTPIPAGFSLRTSLAPRPGRLDTDLGFPIDEGDVVHVFDRDKQAYVLHPFTNGAWSPHPPVMGVGESFWIAKKEARNWQSNISQTTVADPNHSQESP